MPPNFSNIAVVVEIPNKGPRILHTFILPHWLEKGSYRASRSYESFKRGPPPKRKCDRVPWNHPQFPGKFKSPAWRHDRFFYTQRHDLAEFIDECEARSTSAERRGNSPFDERLVLTFHHADLWAFYDHIGWDYKARAYRDAP